jgi:hypothetical protein
MQQKEAISTNRQLHQIKQQEEAERVKLMKQEQLDMLSIQKE